MIYGDQSPPSLAGGIAPPPLIQPQPPVDPMQQSGAGQFNDAASGIQSIAQNFAAGFSKDPARRAQAQQQLQVEQVQRQQELQQLREKQMHYMDTMIQLAANGGATPATTQHVQDAAKPGGSMDRLYGNGAGMQFLQLYQMADAAHKAQYQNKEAKYENVVGPDGKPLGSVNMADPQAVANLPPGWQTTGPVPQPEPAKSAERAAQDLAQAEAGRTSVQIKNEGPIPPDYKRVTDAAGNEFYQVIPGSKTDTEQKAADKTQAQKDLQKQIATDVVTQDVGRALALSKKAFTTGMGGSLASTVPGTEAHNLQEIVKGIGSNITLDRLQQAREGSKTGGALGNVSDTEDKMLQSAYGSLSQSQTKDQFETNLKRVRNIYMDIVHGKGNWTEKDLPAPPEEPAAPGDTTSLQTKDAKEWTDADRAAAKAALGLK